MASIVLTASVVPLLVQLPHDPSASGASAGLLAWLAVGVAGAVLIDRHSNVALGWACVLAAATPLGLTLAGRWWLRSDPAGPPVVRAAEALGPWALLALAAPMLTCIARRRPNRAERRWRVWTIAACAATLLVSTAIWLVWSPGAYGATSAIGLLAVATVIGTSAVVTQPRPVIEPLVDVALVVIGVALAAGSGALMLGLARQERVIAPEVSSALATGATAVLLVPSMWWLRREFLARRYGTGVLSDEDVAALTADLSSTTDPRELLVKAGAMITAASGVAETQLVLDEVEVPEGWDGWRLVIGDEFVGTMLVRPSHVGGLEARQTRWCRQLQPTVALVARAVTLAVDARHARDDVARQRDAERSRMLADLHDDLGPVLAGMSMRVQAARDVHHLPELDALAVDLAACRQDLRRIVAGLGPGPLVVGDLSSALERLVASFDTGRAAQVTLDAVAAPMIDASTAVVVYRVVAEGITNALKHARPSRVTVRVVAGEAVLRATVTDDGVGGDMIPGMGLASLRDRAAEIGGTLHWTSVEPTGTALVLEVPVPCT
ncbi:MAG: hypothetical protein KDB37_09660 [Ilumatobacter sp.]|nr:hypothetical protein [Ilumatobacter sp.]